MRFPTSLAAGLVAFTSLAACSGDGCAGCSGIERIPGGYPRDKAVEGAGAVRITRPGLDLIAEQAPGIAGTFLGATDGVITFDLPKTQLPSKVAGYTVTVCEDGPGGEPPRCRATIQVGEATMHVDAVTPNALRISGTLPLSLSATRTGLTDGAFIAPDIHATLGYGNNPTCDDDHLPVVSPYALPIAIDIPIIAETQAPRTGYATLDLEHAVIDLDGLQSDQVKICADCGFLSGGCDSVLNSGLIKGNVVDALKSGVGAQLNTFLASAFCTKPSLTQTPACPTGSTATGGVDGGAAATCNFDTAPDRCVPQLLGTDAHVNLAGLLAKFSPGSKGSLDFGFAAGGDMTPFPNAPADDTPYAGHTPNGVTLSMVGGVIPSPESKCVVPTNLALPTGIPMPTELTQDTLTGYGDGSKSPDVGLGLSQRFLNYSLKSAYNSGLLCLGVSSEQVALLQTGLLSVLVSSLPTFTFERKTAAAAIATRPGQPPELTLGGGTDINTDPMVKIVVPELAIDFYVWSYDRYVRLFTFTADVTVPLNLSTAVTDANPKGGVAIQLGNVTLAKPSVSNNELLLDKPDQMAAAISQIVGSLVGQFVGTGLAPIDVSQLAASFGLTLEVPAGGIRTLTKDQDQFIGLFANFDSTPVVPPASPRPALVHKSVDRDAMTLTGLRADNLPSLAISIPAVGPDADLEYATRLDQGTYSAWTPALERVVTGPELFMQGKHELRVVARHRGFPGSQSEAGVIPFSIDALAPHVAIEQKNDRLVLDAWDIVSADEALQARIAYDGAALPVEWQPLSAIAFDDSHDSVQVQIRDEEGNVGEVKQPLIRGNRDLTLPSTGGCGSCESAPSDPASNAAWAVAIVFGLWLFKRRAAAGSSSRNASLLTALAATATAAAMVPGCSCGSDDEPVQTTGCGDDCNSECGPGLPQGIVGAYTSVAKASDGTIWVSGYNDSTLSPDFSSLYGDLVVGTYDEAKGAVAWQTVDGLPARAANTCPINDPKGWRKGETDSGPDVGLWTSMALSADQKPMVAYYDATTPALKFALLAADNTWKIHEVFSGAGIDAGRYVKMILDGDKPVLAYLQFQNGTGGAVKSQITLARAKVAQPLSPTDWNFSVVGSWADNPCRAGGCAAGSICESGGSGLCQAQTTGCTPADCGGSSSACVAVDGAPTCVSVRAANAVEAYPNLVGSYVSLAKGKDGLGIVAYDRVHGNLLGFREKAGTFTQTLLDGQTVATDGTITDTGDDGIASTLVIDAAGVWHVAYVEGLDETLRYLTVATDGTVSASSIVDDGFGLTATDRFDDGQHVVGDDAAIRLEGTDGVTIFYQDATVGTLRWATSAGTGDALTWTRKSGGKPGRLGGLFPRPISGETRVSDFFRVTDQTARTMSGDVELVDAK